MVRDGFQRRGLGTELLRRLVAIGRDEADSLPQRRDLAAKHRHAADCVKLGIRTFMWSPIV